MLSCISLTLANKCPRWSCGKNDTLPCAHSTYNATTDYSTVVIEPASSCKKPTICIGYVDDDKRTVNVKGRMMNIFFEANKNEELVCMNDTLKQDKAFPGEACSNDDDCYTKNDNFNSTCVDKKCTGKKADEACPNGSKECLAGLFCNSTLFCNPLKKAGDACEKFGECENAALFCYKKKCTKPLSIKVGEKVDESEIDEEAGSALCEFGYIANSTCAKTVIPENTNKTNFFECELGTQCNYNYLDNQGRVLGNFTRPCECGYNADGKSYCPAATDKNEKLFNDYTSKIYAAKVCHVNHPICNVVLSYKDSPLEAHKYFKAVDCINNISAGFISISSIFMIVLALLF